MSDVLLIRSCIFLCRKALSECRDHTVKSCNYFPPYHNIDLFSCDTCHPCSCAIVYMMGMWAHINMDVLDLYSLLNPAFFPFLDIYFFLSSRVLSMKLLFARRYQVFPLACFKTVISLSLSFSFSCHSKFCSHMVSVWLSLSCWIITLIPPLSLCLFSSIICQLQSPVADTRKSCCFSLLAYVIPTYLYFILCNVFLLQLQHSKQ